MRVFHLVYRYHISEYRLHDASRVIEVWFHTPSLSFLSGLYVMDKKDYEQAKEKLDKRSC